LNWSKAPR